MVSAVNSLESAAGRSRHDARVAHRLSFTRLRPIGERGEHSAPWNPRISVYAVLKLLHVASAIWFASGLLGRAVALSGASRATEISLTKALADLAGTFETRMVIPGSIVVLVTGIVAALVGDVALLGPPQNAPAWPLVGLVVFIAINLLVPTVFLPRGKQFGEARARRHAR